MKARFGIGVAACVLFSGSILLMAGISNAQGPGGFGGQERREPGGPPPGGPGGPPGGRGPGGPPAPGQVMPEFVQRQLNLTEAQKKQIAALQKEVDAKLEKILTADQKKQLKEFRNRPRGGFGGQGRGMASGPPVAANATGPEIYKGKCAGCHGAEGRGGAGGPGIVQAAKDSEGEITGVIRNGKGRMPAFASQLSAAQIKKLVTVVKNFK